MACQGWDVLLARVRECKAALQAMDLPVAEVENSHSSLALPGSVTLDAESGLLMLDLVATNNTGKLKNIPSCPNNASMLQILLLSVPAIECGFYLLRRQCQHSLSLRQCWPGPGCKQLPSRGGS